MKTSASYNPIVFQAENKQIAVSRDEITVTYNISTDLILTIEVLTSAGETEIKIKQGDIEIGSKNWLGRVVAIEYPNKDLWADHPVLNELKITSLFKSNVGGSESSEESLTKQQQTKKGKFLIFPNKK